jgi:hypothetical protein
LIKENGGSGSYMNIAVLPNTATPVSSMNVLIPNFTRADGTTIEGCPAVNEQYFGQSNTASTNSSPINYAGQNSDCANRVIAGSLII